MGFLSGVGDTLKKGVKKYKEYEAKAPERRAKRMADLKAEEKRLQERLQERNQRERVQHLRAKLAPKMPQAGYNPFGASFGQPLTPASAQKKRKKKSKGGSKPKRKEVFYY